VRRIVTLAIVFAVCVPLSAYASSSPPPKAVLRSVVAAALAQRSVHWTAKYSADLYGTATYTASVNAHSGTERMTGPDCYAGASELVRLLFVHHTVYVSGDVCGLLDNLNLTEAQARKYVGQWISVPRSGTEHKLYLSLARGMSLASIVHAVTTPPRHAKLRSFRRSHGTRLVLRANNPQGDPVWELRARASRRLPLALHRGGGCCSPPETSYRFSKWNKPVQVHAPASSTPIATVRAS
jgi:hypothetical protein